MPMTRSLQRTGKLESLAVWSEGICRTRGRFSEQALQKVLGVKSLVVLHPDSRAARLVMERAHAEDHRRDYKDAMWRSRKYARIYRGHHLAKLVIKECQVCRVNKKELVQQRMGDLPDVMTRVPCRPFRHITLDFMGPVWAAQMTNRRKKVKCFVLVIVCMNTRALDLRLTSGYSTEDFLRQFMQHCLDMCTPSFVYCDSGSQLKAAKKFFTSVAPPGCQWRVGRSEAQVKAVKHSLAHLGDSDAYTFEEKQFLLSKIKFAINNCP